MSNYDIVQWLMKNGGPVIRYRTATELTEDVGGYDRDKLTVELIDSKPVKLWLSRCQRARASQA